jgi:hypothetical protein
VLLLKFIANQPSLIFTLAGVQGRVVVVKIYVDPDPQACKKEVLEKFENGHYGPIIEATPQIERYPTFHSGSASAIPITPNSVPRTINYGNYGASQASGTYTAGLQRSSSSGTGTTGQYSVRYDIENVAQGSFHSSETSPVPYSGRLDEDEYEDDDEEGNHRNN